MIRKQKSPSFSSSVFGVSIGPRLVYASNFILELYTFSGDERKNCKWLDQYLWFWRVNLMATILLDVVMAKLPGS